MHLDTVLKPVTGFKVNTEDLDTQLFQKITHTCTHPNHLCDTYTLEGSWVGWWWGGWRVHGVGGGRVGGWRVHGVSGCVVVWVVVGHLVGWVVGEFMGGGVYAPTQPRSVGHDGWVGIGMTGGWA